MIDSMTEKPTSSALVPVKQSNMAYQQDLWDYIFEIWLYLADRNCAATYDIMVKELQDSNVFEPDLYPGLRAIQQRRKKEDWDRRANDIIRSEARHIDETHTARMFVASGKALDLATALIEGTVTVKDRNEAQVLAIRWDAAKELLRFRGLGTAGAVGKPTLEVVIKNEDSDAAQNLRELLAKMTPDEQAEFWRQRTLEGKEHKKLTGHEIKR